MNRIIRVNNFGETDVSATSDSSDRDDEYVPNPSTLKDGWKELTAENCSEVKKDDIHLFYTFKRPIFGQI